MPIFRFFTNKWAKIIKFGQFLMHSPLRNAFIFLRLIEISTLVLTWPSRAAINRQKAKKRRLFYWKCRRNWGKRAQNSELLAPKMRSAPAPSNSVVAVTNYFSERTSIWEKVLKRFLKSERNSRFYRSFNLLRNKKNTRYI